MAVTVASLEAHLDLNKKGFDSGLKESSKQLGGFSGALGGLAAAGLAFGAVTAAFSGVKAALDDLANAARVQINVEKQLDAVLKSTGGAVGLTATEIKKLASELQGVTNFGDEATLSGQNLLLTFTRIGGDVFPRATETMLDMSQALGQDLKSSAIQLGKALNDPLKGFTALQRVGVSFTQSQKDMIKEMVAAGDIAAAQGIILDELATEFGGSARALADPWIQLQNAIGDVKESIGMALLPMLNALAQGVIPAVGQSAEALRPVMEALGGQMGEVLGSIFGLVGGALVELVSSFTLLSDGVRELGAALGLGETKINAFYILLLPLEIPLVLLTGLFKALAFVANVLGATFQSVAYVANQLGAGWQRLTGEGTALGSVARGLTAVWDGMSTAFGTLWQWIQNIIEGWRLLIAVMSQPINTPEDFTPGSPTPFEGGLRGIHSAMTALQGMPALDINRLIPISQAQTGVTNNTTNLNMGGQSMTFQGDNANEQALMTVLKLMRGKLESAG